MSNAANFAAKLSDLNESPYNTYVTREVFNMLSDEAKYGGDEKKLMWQPREWNVHGTTRHLNRSSWTWPP